MKTMLMLEKHILAMIANMLCSKISNKFAGAESNAYWSKMINVKLFIPFMNHGYLRALPQLEETRGSKN